MREGLNKFASILSSAVDMNVPSRFYTLEYTPDLYTDSDGCCIGSLFGINKIEYDFFLQIIGIYTCGKSAQVKINTKVCDLLLSFSDALSRNVSSFKVGDKRNCLCLRLGKLPFEIPCVTERNRFSLQINERLGVPVDLEKCAIFKMCNMKLSELISTYIQLSFTTSIETKVGNTYTCEGIKNVKRLKHIQERNRDFEAITKKFYIKDGVWRSVLCTNDRSVKVYTGKEVDKICPSCVNAVKSISRHRTPILYQSDFHYSFNQLKETFFSLIKNCGSDFDTSHDILSIARALHEMKDTVKEKDLLSKSKPFRYENDGESYCVMFCRGYEIGDKFRCNTLIRTKSSHWKQMDKFCAFCNQNNWKETKKKIKRDTEDKEAKRRRIEFTNLIKASPETLKEKIVGKNVTIKELRKQLGFLG